MKDFLGVCIMVAWLGFGDALIGFLTNRRND